MLISRKAILTLWSSTVKQNGIYRIFLFAVITLNDFKFKFLPIICNSYAIFYWNLNVELIGPYISVYIPLHIVSPWHKNVQPIYFTKHVTGTLNVGKFGIYEHKDIIRSFTILYEINYWCKFFYALLSNYFLFFLILATLIIIPSIKYIPI